MFALAPAASHYDVLSSDYRSTRRVPAWLMSVGLHSCLFVLGALLIHSPTKGPSVEPNRTAGIALVQRTQAETTYFTEEDVASMSSTTATSATDSSSQPSPLAELPLDLAIQLPSSDELSRSPPNQSTLWYLMPARRRPRQRPFFRCRWAPGWRGSRASASAGNAGGWRCGRCW